MSILRESLVEHHLSSAGQPAELCVQVIRETYPFPIQTRANSLAQKHPHFPTHPFQGAVPKLVPVIDTALNVVHLLLRNVVQAET